MSCSQLGLTNDFQLGHVTQTVYFTIFTPGESGVKFDSPQKIKSFSPDLFHGDGGVYLYSKVLLLLLQTLSDAHFM